MLEFSSNPFTFRNIFNFNEGLTGLINEEQILQKGPCQGSNIGAGEMKDMLL